MGMMKTKLAGETHPDSALNEIIQEEEQRTASTLDGFEEVALRAVAVDWRKERSVTGRVVGGDILVTENGERRVLFLDAKGSPRMVWEAANLRRLFDIVKLGDDVHIESQGTVELDSGRTMRVFRALRKPGSGRESPFAAAIAASREGSKGGSREIPF